MVQLYARDPVASITRPVRELIGFARVTLAAGASARVKFRVPVSSLGFSGREFAYVVEPGDIEFFVGSSSSDLAPAGTVADHRRQADAHCEDDDESRDHHERPVDLVERW